MYPGDCFICAWEECIFCCCGHDGGRQCVLYMPIRFIWPRLLFKLFCGPSVWIFCCCCCSAKSPQLCPTLWDPIDSSPPGSLVPGILQARTLEWVAISFSNAWKWRVRVKLLSHVRLLATPWTAAYQAPASMGFSRQEYWSGVPLPSPLNILFIIKTGTLKSLTVIGLLSTLSVLSMFASYI